MEDRKFSLIRYWVTHSLRDLHVLLAVISAATAVIAKVSGENQYQVISDITGIFLILHYCIHGFYYRQYRFISDNQRVYSIPKKKIKKIGLPYLAGFIFFITVAMALAKELYTGTLYGKIKALIMYLLGLIFGKLLDNDGLGRDDLLFADKKGFLGIMNGVSADTDSVWDTILNSLQSILIFVGLIGVLILCLSFLISFIKTKLGGMKLRNEEGKVLETEDREEKLQASTSGFRRFFDTSAEAKIRNLYRKTIKRYKKKNQPVEDWMSPMEIERLVKLSENTESLKLHELYEKARYSKEGCSQEDLSRASSLKL